jgi:hypothetical protein
MTNSIELDVGVPKYEAQELSPLPPEVRSVLLIPIRAEILGLEKIISSLSGSPKSREIAIIVLVNHSTNCPGIIAQQNEKLVQMLRKMSISDDPVIPHIRFAYSPNRPGRVHFGKLRKELLSCARECGIASDAVCYMHDADTLISLKTIETLRNLYQKNHWSANVASHDLSPLTVADKASLESLGYEVDRYNVDLLTNYDMHRLVDAIDGTYHLILSIDAYHTNTPAISATFELLSKRDVSSLLSANEVAEDYALAGWLRKNLDTSELGNYGRVLYGGKVRLAEDTHHGDAEERAFLHSHIRGGGVEVDYDPISESLQLLSEKHHNLFSLTHTARLLLSMLESGDLISENHDDLVLTAIEQSLFLDLVDLTGLSEVSSYQWEIQQVLTRIASTFIQYVKSIKNQHTFIFQDDYKSLGDKHPLVGVNEQQMFSEKGALVLGAYLSKELIRTHQYDESETPRLSISSDQSFIFGKLYALAELLSKNDGKLAQFKQAYEHFLSEEIRYEKKVLRQRRNSLAEIFHDKQLSLDQAKPFAEVLGTRIRSFFAGDNINEGSIIKLPKQYSDLLIFSEIHLTIAKISALRRVVLQLRLAVIKE